MLSPEEKERLRILKLRMAGVNPHAIGKKLGIPRHRVDNVIYYFANKKEVLFPPIKSISYDRILAPLRKTHREWFKPKKTK